MRNSKNIIITSFFIMLPTLFFGYMSKTTEMTIALIAGFTSVVLINIDKFESFKAGAGKLEAKLKKAEKIIDNGNATIEQLNSVVIPLLKSNLTSLIYAGSLDGIPIEEKEKMFYKLIEIKETLTLDELDDDIVVTAKGITNDYFIRIYYEVARIDDEFKSEYKKYTRDNNRFNTPSVMEIELFFEQYPELLKGNTKENFKKFKMFKEKYISE